MLVLVVLFSFFFNLAIFGTFLFVGFIVVFVVVVLLLFLCLFVCFFTERIRL